MKLRRLMGLAATAAAVMTGAAIISIPAASAATDGDVFTEDFEGMALTDSAGAASTMQTLFDDGWYPVDNNKAYTNVDVSQTIYQFATVMGDETNHFLRINTPKSLSTNYKLGLGRLFPGQGTNASGIWEINFRFMPYYKNATPVQFNFSMNTYGAEVDENTAQHNIISAYNNKMYLGYRDYFPLYNGAGVPQGRLDGNLPLDWYDVKVIVNCDSKYYSVELSHDGSLFARRSAISFAGDETIGFFKLSALGMTVKGQNSPAAVYVDDISIKPVKRETLIYNENFNAFTGVKLVNDGITTGGETEDVSGHSYFGGFFTPWRAHSDIGNSYDLETDTELASQVVRLGSDEAGSGLVYMPAFLKLADAETQPVRGMVKTGFKIKPETIGDSGMKLNAIGDHTQDITADNSVAFEIADNDGTPIVMNEGSGVADLDPEKWYDVDLIFDVIEGTVATTVTSDGGEEIASFVKEVGTIKEKSALKGIMFNVPQGSSVLTDDIKIEYYIAPEPAPVVGKIAAVDKDSNPITDIENVPTNLWAIQIPFGCTLDPATANKATITFMDEYRNLIDYRAKIENNSYYIYIDESVLEGGTQYQVTVPATVANISGDELGQEYKFKFTTAGSKPKPVVGKIAAVDKSGNLVTDINNVPLDLWAIQIPFGCTLDPATANKDTITFMCETGDPIDYRAKIEKNSYYIYIDDEGVLESGTEYQVTVPATVANASGDALGQEFKFKLKTITDTPVPSSGAMNIRSVQTGGEDITALDDITAGSTINIITDYSNNTEEAMVATGIVVFYSKDGGIAGMVTDEAIIEPDATATDDPTFAIDVPSDLDMTKIDKVKIFLWDGFSNIMPYCPKVSI